MTVYSAGAPSSTANSRIYPLSISNATGTDLVQIVPAGVAWRICSAYFDLACDSTSTNRVVLFSAYAPTNLKRICQSGINSNQTASLVRSYVVTPGAGLIGQLTTDGGAPHTQRWSIPWPTNLWIPEGGLYATASINLQASDAFQNVEWLIEERKITADGSMWALWGT